MLSKMYSHDTSHLNACMAVIQSGDFTVIMHSFTSLRPPCDYVHTLFDLAEAASASRLNAVLDERIAKVILLIKRNLDRDLTLDRMAGYVQLSPSRLRHMFKDQSGMTPTQYLNELRMRESKRLLETTDLSVKEIMGRVGINDPSNFTRSFKKAHGLTPTQLRFRLVTGESGKDAPPVALAA
jgi:AraC-like DNA-binding protein